MRPERIVFLFGALIPAAFAAWLLWNGDGSGTGYVLLMLSGAVVWMAFSGERANDAFMRAMDTAYVWFRRAVFYLAALWFVAGAVIMWLTQPGSLGNLVAELLLLGIAAIFIRIGSRGIPKP